MAKQDRKYVGAPMSKFDVIRWVVASDLILITLILDQVSKWYVLEYVFKPIHRLPRYEDFFDWIGREGVQLPPATTPIIDGFFNLTMVWNQGVSFGMMNDMFTGPQVLIALACVISLIFAYILLKSKSIIESIGCALVIGGALGNVIDRVRYGAVADFFDFYYEDFHFPAFNVADSAITVGIALILIYGLFMNKEKLPKSVA